LSGDCCSFPGWVSGFWVGCCGVLFGEAASPPRGVLSSMGEGFLFNGKKLPLDLRDAPLSSNGKAITSEGNNYK
jgi:hypothetical protein